MFKVLTCYSNLMSVLRKTISVYTQSVTCLLSPLVNVAAQKTPRAEGPDPGAQFLPEHRGPARVPRPRVSEKPDGNRFSHHGRGVWP